MLENQESLVSQFLKSILENAAKIPHDPKFPYLTAFAEKMKAQYAENPNLTVSQVIEGLNKDIAQNSKKRLFSSWFATSSSASTGATSAALTIANVATSATSIALPAVAAIPTAVNLVYGAMNKGWQLNRDLEGRGYLLKYLENVMVLMIGDLHEKREALAERIELEQDEVNKDLLQTQMRDLENALESSANELWQFNETHYKKEPFYYKWAAMSFKGVGSLTGAARLGISIAATTTAFYAPPVAIGLASGLVACDIVFTGLYRKSHRLRNEGAEKCAKNLDRALEATIGYYQAHEKAASLEDLGNLTLASPTKARENLKDALKKSKPEEYAKFLYRNHPEELKDEHLWHLDQKQKDELEKKRKHDEKHKHHGHGHGHGHHDENHEQETHHKHHHHNILDRYFGDDCSHHLAETTSENEVHFQDLLEVNCEEEFGFEKSKASILPFPTHVHLPSLNIAPVNALMTFLERATGAVARIMGGRKYKSVAVKSPQALSTEDLGGSAEIAVAVNGDKEPEILATYGSEVAGEEGKLSLYTHSPDLLGQDSQEEFGFPLEKLGPPAFPNRTFTLSGRSGLVGENPTVASTQL